jgi:hypothetical protein
MADMNTNTDNTPKRKKLDKYNGFNVQPRTRKSTKWTIYIYELIKEANSELLKNDLVKTAYNNLVDCLLKYDNIFESWIPSKYNKYNKLNGIMLNEKAYYSLMGIPGRWKYNWEHDPIIQNQIKKDSKDITDTYTILYELIKRDIIPYMELKQYEITSKIEIQYYHNQMKKIEDRIKLYEQAITNAHTVIYDYAEKVLKLQQPPTLTTFD